MKRVQMMAVAALLVGGAALRADERTDPVAVIEKAIKAHGGAEAFNKTQAGTIKATGGVNSLQE